jgi:hypothetical protein
MLNNRKLQSQYPNSGVNSFIIAHVYHHKYFCLPWRPVKKIIRDLYASSFRIELAALKFDWS